VNSIAVSLDPVRLDQSLTISPTFHNSGTSSAVNVKVDYYLSTASDFTGSNHLVGTHYVNLAAGLSIEKNMIVSLLSSLSELTPGSYFVYLAISNQDDWYRVSPIDVQALGYTLTVPTITATPNPLTIDTALTITPNITNTGAYSANSIEIKYYLSSDTTFNDFDFYLGRDNVTLASGASGTETVTTSPLSSINGLTPGVYYLGITIPSQTETWYRNGTIEVTSSDLLIQSANITLGPVRLDQSFTATPTIFNTGNATASNKQIQYYLSIDTFINGNDIYLGSDFVNVSISGTTSETITVSPLSTVNNLHPGTYFLGILIPDENDSWVHPTSITILPAAFVDLELLRFNISAHSSRIDQSLTIISTIMNAGDADSINTEIEYYLSSDSSISNLDFYLGNSFISLVSGATLEDNLTVNPLSSIVGLTTGTYYLGALIPSENESWVYEETIIIQPVAPDTTFCTSPHIAIFDDNSRGVDSVLAVSSPDTANGLVLHFVSDHSYPGDLIATLSHNETSIILMDRPSFPTLQYGCDHANIDLMFDDASTQPVESACNPPSSGLNGTFAPHEQLSIFDGMPMNGDWTLNVSDNFGGWTGNIESWCLIQNHVFDGSFE